MSCTLPKYNSPNAWQWEYPVKLPNKHRTTHWKKNVDSSSNYGALIARTNRKQDPQARIQIHKQVAYMQKSTFMPFKL